jgi:hypothetical protein
MLGRVPTRPAVVVPDLRVGLRLEVGRLRARETRRIFDTIAFVGDPGGAHDSFVVRAQDLPVMDAAMRTDVLAALLDQGPPEWRRAWIVRAGTPEQHDLDLAWLSAARTAFAILDRPLDTFHAVTRSGWRDVRTGETRTWVRLRLRD